MRTITLEEHFLTAEALKATEGVRNAGLALTYHDAKLKADLLDIGAGRIAAMDASGIDLQVLSLAVCGVEELESEQAVAIAHDTNEQIAAAVRAYPKRFAGFATLALQDPEKAAAELEYCVSKLGFCGALINGTTKGYFLDHPRFTPLLEVGQALDVPIYIHPAPPPKSIRDVYYSDLPNHAGDILCAGGWGWHSEVALESLRLIAAGVFDRFPKLKIIIGHMGEYLPFSIGRVDRILSRPHLSFTFTPEYNGDWTRLQRKVTEYFHENFWITTSGFYTLPPLLLALQVMGSEHVLFSVDYPFAPNEPSREFLNTLTSRVLMNEEDIERLVGGNAAKLLRV